MQFTWVESNIWKYFLIQFTNRRNFIPILSVYFLTLPDTRANQIGLYMGIGAIAAMFMQMPSGYIADHYGQKVALIISKLLVLTSTFLYIIADSFIIFMLGAVCMAIGLHAFSSGTSASFLKWTLEKLGRGDEYREVASKISGNVSLASIGFILVLPFLTEIDMRAPLIVAGILDIIGLVIAWSIVPIHTKIEQHEKKPLRTLIRELRGTGFFPYALFVAIISGFLFADQAYRSPYLVSLGYPLIYIWFVMAASRLVWWYVGRSVKTIERYISFKKLIILEIFVFPIYYITTGYIENPWIVGTLFALIVGWFWWRSEIYTDHLIDRISDKRYRATALSLKSQMQNILEMSVSFGIAGVMGISYALGYQVLWVVMFFLLCWVYYFGIRRTTEQHPMNTQNA